MGRVLTANRTVSGTTYAMAYTYDLLGNVTSAFGNLTKSGSVSFQPTYNAAINRMQSLPGFTPTYDANGNTLTDSLHTYTWDVQGQVTAVDTVGLTYDALGRMVEQNRSGSYTQILYGPTGGKLALMNGQTVVKAFIPLPAGATAVYTAGPTLSYIRHPDWLGSSRFASTPSRTMYSDLAYAPFGETYAEAGTADRSFTGQNQDTIQGSTTGLYDFMFREYAQYGRWISPDPAGLAAVDLAAPQTWNRYAYVGNDVMNSVDPLGLRMVVYTSITVYGGPAPQAPILPIGMGGNAAADPIAASFLGSGWGQLSKNATMLRPKDGPGDPANNGTTPPQQPVKPPSLPMPNVPSGAACDKYTNPILKAICNGVPNGPTSNCIRGYLLDSYDPKSGYSPGLIPAHCDAWASCGVPQPLVWGACLTR